jgi:1,4-alpha-glucan branching enzyme
VKPQLLLTPPSIIFVLHSHLPYLNQSTIPLPSVEETWFYEAVIESYIPLIFSFKRLKDKGIPFKLVLSLSPTLLDMLENQDMQRGLKGHLERLKDLAEFEERRLKGSPFEEIIRFYRERFEEIGDFLQRVGIMNALKEFSETGNIKLITTTATHAYLPLFSQYPWVVELQIRVGIEIFKRHIWWLNNTGGFWLPECGYFRGLFKYLKSYHIEWTVLEGHSIAFGTPRSRYGVFRPVRTPEGIFVFPRDSSTCKLVWSRERGYPGNLWYRDFYRDACYELKDSEWKRFRPDGIRHHTGLKYWRITGRERKAPYIRQRALKQVEVDARHFVDFLKKRAIMAKGFTHNPVIVVAFDTELFGHWWFEGPDWLEKVFELLSSATEVALSFPEDILNQVSTVTELASFELVDPLPSSWGEGGFSDTWISKKSSFYLRSIYRAIELASSYLRQPLPSIYSFSESAETRLDKELIKELLLLQSSDFLFMINKDSGSRIYGEERLKRHLKRIGQIIGVIQRSRRISDFKENFSIDSDF